MTSYKMARRSFLRGCGGSAALMLPLLRSMEARAQGMPAPRRLLILHHCQGSPIDLWRPAASATTTTFTLPANSAPFAPLQSKMVMIDGLNLVTASLSSNGLDGGQNTSEGGMVALMTGVPTIGKVGQQDHCAGGPSIDQILLDRSPLLGGALSSSPTKTPFGSLQLAADARSSRDEVAPRVMSYRSPTGNADLSQARQPMYPDTQPLNVFNRLFGGAMPPGTDKTAALARELSVLDFMRSDLTRLRTLAPGSEKDRLDAHASAIQQLESTLRQTLTGGPSVCTTPAAPPMFAATSTGRQAGNTTEYTTIAGVDYYDPADPNNHPHQLLGQAQLALIKAAFLCDLARVVTFSWSSATSWVVFPATFDGATLFAGSSSPHYPPLSSMDAGSLAWWTAIDRFYAQQSSLAIQSMAAATDVDGNSLLDNTVVVYVTELSRRWDHDQRNMPLLVFGGKNTGLKGGTFLKISGGPLPTQIDGATGNRPFNDFWLALAPAFGVDLRALGAANQFTGPLAGLFG